MPKEGAATLDFEAVNQAKALWTRPRTEITDDEYREFYRHITHDGEAPAGLEPQQGRGQARVHQPAVHPGPCALRPVPARCRARPEAARAARVHHGRRRAVPAAVPALHQGRARFLRPATERLARAAAEGSGSRGHEQRADASARWTSWPAWPRTIRRNTASSGANSARCSRRAWPRTTSNRDKLLPLLRFASTHEAGDEDKTALADYVARMQPGQQKIYYVVADSARGGPRQPVHRAVARAQGRGAAAGRSRGPVDHGPVARIRGQSLPGCRERRPGPHRTARGRQARRRLRRSPTRPRARRCSSAWRRRWAMRWPA